MSAEGSQCVCPEGAERGTLSLQSSGGRQRVVLSVPCDSWAFPYIRGGSWVSVNSFSFPGPLCDVCPGKMLLFCWSLCRGSVHVLTEPCSSGGAGGVCGCCSPCSAPRPSSFCVSPVNQTLQALGSTVTQEQGVLEQSSAVLPLSPAPFAFLVSTSLPVLSKGKNFLQITHFWGHTLKWQRVPSSSTGRHLQSPRGQSLAQHR